MPIAPQPTRPREVSGRRIGLGLVLLIAAFFAGMEWMGFRDTLPPRSRSGQAMALARERILRHAVEHGAPPGTLAELGQPASDASPVDGWGLPLLYETDGERVWLRSLGHDAEPGGSGQDADLEGAFWLRAADGGWAGADEPWLLEPLSGVAR